MSAESRPVPLFHQPDPAKPHWIRGRCERLERRGPGDLAIVGTTLEGRPAEARLVPFDPALALLERLRVETEDGA